MKPKIAGLCVCLLLIGLFSGGRPTPKSEPPELFADSVVVALPQTLIGYQGNTTWEVQNDGGTCRAGIATETCIGEGQYGQVTAQNDRCEPTRPGLTVAEGTLKVGSTNYGDAYDNGLEMWVRTDQTPGTTKTVFAAPGGNALREDRTIEAEGPIDGVTVTVNYYAAADSPTLRTLVSFTNPSSTEPRTIAPSWVTNVGDNTSVVVGSSSSTSDTTYSNDDRWVVTKGTATDPPTAVNTHVIFGPEAAETPDTVSEAVFGCGTSSEKKGIRTDFSFEVPAGQTRSLLFFNGLSDSEANAEAYGSTFSPTFTPNIGDEILDGLSAGQLTNVVNWKFVFENFLLVGPGGGSTPEVKLFALDSQGANAAEFLDTPLLAYDSGFRGGVRVASGDVDGDGIPEIITGAGPPGGPHVKVFKVDVPGGKVTQTAYAEQHVYDSGFGGGVYVAAGDVDGDSKAEVITAAGESGGPHVKVWDIEPNNEVTGTATFVLKRGFYAYSPFFGGGVRVASGNVSSQGSYEILTVPASGVQPLKAFSMSSSGGMSELLMTGPQSGGLDTSSGFFPYESGYSGGIFVGTGNVTGSATEEIITGPGGSRATTVRAFEFHDSGVVLTVAEFIAYPGFTGGVRVGGGDVDTDDFFEIITGAGPPGGPHLKTWNVSATVGEQALDHYAYNPAYGGGIYVSGWRRAWGT